MSMTEKQSALIRNHISMQEEMIVIMSEALKIIAVNKGVLDAGEIAREAIQDFNIIAEKYLNT